MGIVQKQKKEIERKEMQIKMLKQKHQPEEIGR